MFNVKRYSWIFLAGLVLAVAVLIRISTFYLPHDVNDEVFFLGTALKLDKFGMGGYNLRGLDVRRDTHFFSLFPSPEGTKGSILQRLAKKGIYYYDEPLHHIPPLFPYALMFSHRVFAKERPYLAVKTDLKGVAIIIRPKEFLTGQFYCSIVPFVFSLLFILAVFLLGKIFFGERIGFYAALFISIAPIDILTSQRIWADDMVCFFLTLSALLFLSGHKNNNLLFSGAAGLAGGLATLAKQTGGFIVFAVVIYCIWQARKDLLTKRILKVIFNRHLIVFGAAMFLTTLPWFYLMTKTYGVPWYQPSQHGLDQVGWFGFISNRPWYTYLLGIPYHMPLFVLGYLQMGIVFWIVFKRNSSSWFAQTFLLFWFLAYFLILNFYFNKSIEHRFMLPAYAPLAIFSAIRFDRFVRYLNGKFSHSFCNITAVLLVVACALWSIRIGLTHVFIGFALIPEPF